MKISTAKRIVGLLLIGISVFFGAISAALIAAISLTLWSGEDAMIAGTEEKEKALLMRAVVWLIICGVLFIIGRLLRRRVKAEDVMST